MNQFSGILFHTKSIGATVQELQSGLQGLSQSEVNVRLASYGENKLDEKKNKPAWMLFLQQFADFMILILIAAAIISGLAGDLKDTIIILIIVVLNALIGFIQEYRAEKAMDALRQMTVVFANVRRDEQWQTIQSKDIVPGDLVQLEAGNVVPADIRLCEVHNLRIDESTLTGESVPVNKATEAIADAEASLGDRLNMAYKGTLVNAGRATGMVVATGMATEIGKIAQMLQQEESDTPLKQRMKVFGKRLSVIILIICAVLFGAGLLRGEDPLQMLLLSISLAVAAIPEALPALITISLARGAAIMVKRNALIRKLPAVETLGSVSYICSDKTGTLTLNKMTVVEKKDLGLQLPQDGSALLTLSMALNHDVVVKENGEVTGESTEVALVNNIIKSEGLDAFRKIAGRHTRVAELPFDSDRKAMTTVHHFQDKFLIITKGASESIAAVLLANEDSALLENTSQHWAEQGLRVLAYAYKVADTLPEPFDYDHVEKGMHLTGLVGIIDPPREEVKLAIAECRTAGIKPVMITGDHPATAIAIARAINLMQENDEAISGKQLEALDDAAFLERVEQTSVYARVSPAQKLRIVKALQAKKHYVAMTGDGVNDAPSLKAANIGVAMGINGTDVSKEAAHMILLDDNFATIVNAVREGRRIFDNIRKFVKYIMTCNGAEIWTILLAPVLGLPIPLLPIHILWINLVTDGLPGLALGSEKAEADIMKRQPRPAEESLFAGGLGYHIIWVGILMAGITLGMQAWAISNQMDHWQTMVFTVLAFCQLAHALAIRVERRLIFSEGFFGNRQLIASVLFTFLLQLGVIYIPAMNKVFNTQPLTLNELLICIGLAAVLFHAVEFEKIIQHWRRKKQPGILQQ